MIPKCETIKTCICMWVKRRVFVDLADRVQCETKIPCKAGSCFSSSECTQKTIARHIL